MANYTLLEKITVGAAGASSVTFNSIPQTGYTDLVVKLTARTNNTSPNILFSINGSTSTFSSVALYGDGASASSTSGVPRIVSYTSFSTDTSNTFGNTEIYIPNYTSSNNKSYSVDTVGENNATTAYSGLFAGLWSTTSAITSLTFTPASSGSFVANSTFYLYGVAKLGTTPTIVPYATGGDTIMTDGTYWYHAFTSSGTFTPAKGLSCDVLVVAGGGGGRRYAGGGAGGVYYSASTSVSSAQTVTVGAGGVGNNETGPAITNGSNSVFGSLTAAVGGGRGGESGSGTPANNNGAVGGSGGGGGYDGSGGAGTSGQGNAGGAGATNGTSYSGGSGGGAGAAASASTAAATANGGAGVNTYSSWLSVTGLGVGGFIAGGGSGGTYRNVDTVGTGGSGGGGVGAKFGSGGPISIAGSAGVENTGSGGGGAYNGGSGLVIVRYAV